MSEPDDRHVFRYFDGAREVYGDPYVLQRELRHALGRDVGEVLAEARAGDEILAYAAATLLLAAVRQAFGMAPWNPETNQGAQELHCRRALNGLLDFFAGPASASGSPPTSPPPTASASSPSPTSASSGSG